MIIMIMIMITMILKITIVTSSTVQGSGGSFKDRKLKER